MSFEAKENIKEKKNGKIKNDENTKEVTVGISSWYPLNCRYYSTWYSPGYSYRSNRYYNKIYQIYFKYFL